MTTRVMQEVQTRMARPLAPGTQLERGARAPHCHLPASQVDCSFGELQGTSCGGPGDSPVTLSL